MNKKFYLGELYITEGARRALQKTGQNGLDFIERHAHGDWGEANAEDVQANYVAIQTQGRVLSVYYTTSRGVKLDKFYVITEADRSMTTLLLADEY